MLAGNYTSSEELSQKLRKLRQLKAGGKNPRQGSQKKKSLFFDIDGMVAPLAFPTYFKNESKESPLKTKKQMRLLSMSEWDLK